MWKSEVPLSDTLRMIDLVKEIDINKYSQVEYREVVSSIMISFILIMKIKMFKNLLSAFQGR